VVGVNLVRLAQFNIKKHKAVAGTIIVLIFFCQLFLGVGIQNIASNIHLFEDKMAQMESVQNIYCVEGNRYTEEYKTILEEDDRVSKVVVQDSVFWWQNNIQMKNGVDFLCNSIFINETDENVLERIVLEKAEISTSMEHPIYLPLIFKDYYGFALEDEFRMTFHQQVYTFEVAGFYETTIFANANMGAIKFIVSNEDYEKLSNSYGETKLIGYNVPRLEDIQAVKSDFISQAKALSDGANSFQALLSIDYIFLTSVTTMFPVLLAYLLLLFAVIIIITIFIVIRHRITNSIEEQMKNIGTLEALGYTSKQITGIYVIEYSLLAVIGTVLGSVVSRLVLPLVNAFSSNMLGLRSEARPLFILDIIIIISIIMIVALVSFSKANKVKQYPPVIAFRKGINNHHFKKNYFALEKTRSNVHLRLAGKRFMGAIKQNIMIGICVTVATAAMMFSMLLYSSIGKNQTAVQQMSGFEMCDLQVSMTHAMSGEDLKEELLELPEVRKVNMTHDYLNISLSNLDILSVVYKDYGELETLNTYEGRMPIYDNEIAITGALAKQLGKEIGDSIEATYNGYSKKYLISGISQSMINNGQTLYFTEEGIKYIHPSYQSDMLDVYLTEGTDKKAFIKKLEKQYGQSLQTAREGEGLEGESELQAKAQEKIASLISLYGVDSIDYAIMIDGEIIKGSSKQFAIDLITDIEEHIGNNIGAYVEGINWGTKAIMIVSVIIIMIIIAMLIKNQLVQQRLDLGIYKGLGYTTKELMLQITLSLMPAIIIGVICGSLLAIWGSPTILSGAFRVVGVTHMIMTFNVQEIILLGLGTIGFSFIAAMLSAYRIKDISAYELLVE